MKKAIIITIIVVLALSVILQLFNIPSDISVIVGIILIAILAWIIYQSNKNNPKKETT